MTRQHLQAFKHSDIYLLAMAAICFTSKQPGRALMQKPELSGLKLFTACVENVTKHTRAWYTHNGFWKTV